MVDFAVPVDHRVKLKENERKVKYMDIAKELKRLLKMKMTFLPIVIDVFGTVTEGLIKVLEDLEITGRMETIQTTALLRSARRVLRNWRNLLSLKLQWKFVR